MVTKLSHYSNTGGLYDEDYERNNIYTYHPDHLGSSNFITDPYGNEFEHIEYTPYGESWVEEGTNLNIIGYKFTSKELDTETGLYYFGARYLDPQTSRWMSADPILDDYFFGIMSKKNINPLNFSLYTYCGNNPIIYVDPNGNKKSGIEYWLFRIFMGKDAADKLCGDWRCDGAQEMADKMLDIEASFIPGTDTVQDIKSLATGKTINGEETSRLLALASLFIPISFSAVGNVAKKILNQKMINVLYKTAGTLDPEGLSMAGRAFQKHSSRGDLNANRWGKIMKGGNTNLNLMGEKNLNEILESDKQVVKKLDKYIEIFIPNGRGVRMTKDGTFDTFLDIEKSNWAKDALK